MDYLYAIKCFCQPVFKINFFFKILLFLLSEVNSIVKNIPQTIPCGRHVTFFLRVTNNIIFVIKSSYKRICSYGFNIVN